MSAALYAANSPARFWRLLLEPEVSAEEWARAIGEALPCLPPTVTAGGAGPEQVLLATLGEGQFGPGHWQLSLPKRVYYAVKPFLPRRIAVGLRRGYHHRQQASDGGFPLNWPTEDRFVRFQLRTLAGILRGRGLDAATHIGFWPHGHRAALVLTHDVEDTQGQEFVLQVADLEERLGFRSAFNFVAERYPVDHGILAELRARGFEVGVHGVKHDGKLFSSRRAFERRAGRINTTLRDWGAAGFRSPLTHRNPEWMQSLAVEYDTSFFDTDPYEVMPGGTMSIWPFFLGHFVELPYTLVQDHTLLVILGERTPALWLQKAEFVARSQGMILVNSHPDYLREPAHLTVYAQFLEALTGRNDLWQALPGEVARWWRARADTPAQRIGTDWDVPDLPGATLVTAKREALEHGEP